MKGQYSSRMRGNFWIFQWCLKNPCPITTLQPPVCLFSQSGSRLNVMGHGCLAGTLHHIYHISQEVSLFFCFIYLLGPPMNLRMLKFSALSVGCDALPTSSRNLDTRSSQLSFSQLFHSGRTKYRW